MNEIASLPDSSFSLPPDSVAYYADHQEQRSRLTTFFRFLTLIPPVFWLAIYGLGAFFVTVYAWFVLLFTAQFPTGAYEFLVKFQRYSAKVNSYGFLITDAFPGFSGSADEPYASHLLIGPPKERYSRAKVFFRFILYIPFYIVAYVLTLVGEIAAIVAWFVIVVTGKQPKGLQDALTFCVGYIVRTQVWYGLLTEDWPKFSDEAVTVGLQQKGYQGTIPPAQPTM